MAAPKSTNPLAIRHAVSWLPQIITLPLPNPTHTGGISRIPPVFFQFDNCSASIVKCRTKWDAAHLDSSQFNSGLYFAHLNAPNNDNILYAGLPKYETGHLSQPPRNLERLYRR